MNPCHSRPLVPHLSGGRWARTGQEADIHLHVKFNQFLVATEGAEWHQDSRGPESSGTDWWWVPWDWAFALLGTGWMILRTFLVPRFYNSTEVLNVLGENTCVPLPFWSAFLRANSSLSEPQSWVGHYISEMLPPGPLMTTSQCLAAEHIPNTCFVTPYRCVFSAPGLLHPYWLIWYDGHLIPYVPLHGGSKTSSILWP